MSFEIEHKYLVKSMLFKDMSFRHFDILQGYICRNEDRVVRVRIADNKGFLTVKGKNIGDTRLEFEYEVAAEDARAMLSLCTGRIINKTRWIVKYDGRTWEVDEFHDDLAPLVTAEIELSHSDEKYTIPPFVGDEVTSDPRYYNSNL